MATPHVRKLTMAAPVVKQEPEVPSGFGLLAASSSSLPNMTEASIEELTGFKSGDEFKREMEKQCRVLNAELKDK